MSYRHREQARSHIGFMLFTRFVAGADPLWERACSRRQWHSHKHCRLTHRFREQARSHNCLVLFAKFVVDTGPCGSEPARDGGGTVKNTVA
jgi:hypothetical protein